MTPEQAVAIWGILAEANPGTPMSETTVRVRAELILDLDYEEAKAAAMRLAKTSRWVPGVAEFRDAVLAPAVLTPDEVWEEIRSLVQRRGWPSPPGPDDCSPEAWLTIKRFGGWQAICEGREDVSRAHVLKEIAPRVIEQRRRDVLADPGLPELDPPRRNPFELPEGDE